MQERKQRRMIAAEARRTQRKSKTHGWTNSDGCPVPRCGTGRYKFKGKDNRAGGTPALATATSTTPSFRRPLLDSNQELGAG